MLLPWLGTHLYVSSLHFPPPGGRCPSAPGWDFQHAAGGLGSPLSAAVFFTSVCVLNNSALFWR